MAPHFSSLCLGHFEFPLKDSLYLRYLGLLGEKIAWDASNPQPTDSNFAAIHTSTYQYTAGRTPAELPVASPTAPAINDFVNFGVQSPSLNLHPIPDGPAGVFTLTTRFANTRTVFMNINAIVKTLTNDNKLLSATEGNGGVGSKQSIDAGSDDTLIPRESRTV